ncbi:MAG: UPF0280 family protein [Euryarchaeota archaeon]|nr:UPF0280 family protein [Euryarchaeota archaeon]
MKEKFQLKQTVVTIVADTVDEIERAKEAIRSHRRQLEYFIGLNPFFRYALEPFDDYVGTPPEIVRRMMAAAGATGVGPMAAVAGVIADLAVEAMVRAGASYAVVDNGGDIALSTDREVIVGIYAGDSAFSNLGFKVSPTPFCGICTSSATVGPSISFGTADVACVVAQTACLADAAASALGNMSAHPHEAFEALKNIRGVDGALLIVRDKLATWGVLPTLIRTSLDTTCITHA